VQSALSVDDPGTRVDRDAMTTPIVIVKNKMTQRNGNGYHPALTLRQANELVDREARRILDVSGDEAIEMLDRGDLEGTAAEAELRMLQFLARPAA
jgi:hypothetical protein